MANSKGFSYFLYRHPEVERAANPMKTMGPQNMDFAINEVRNNQMKFLKAAKTFGEPRFTLFRLVAETSSEPSVHQSNW